MLRKELWHLGLRYRKNVSGLAGKPDIVFRGPRVAVFYDGDFWHGRDWELLKSKLLTRANPGYWIPKIASNIERDQQNNAILLASNWLVIRMWETDIKRDPHAAALEIREIVLARRQCNV